jgi:hypothetical protein
MAQVTMFFDESYPFAYKRDYLQGRLSRILSAGKSYCITFYVNFEGVYSSTGCGYAIDHIGAYLDNGAIDLDTGVFCGIPHPTIIPQVYATSIITDTVNWTKIQGSFIATGSERFITMGNFFDNAHTNSIVYPGHTAFSWYLVDDVSVIESTETANAGPDVVIAHGDSVHIGSYFEGMPCNWYKLGNTTILTHNGGLWVKPDSTTSYVVELDLCGNVTRDTVTVTIDRTGVEKINRLVNVIAWPNPANNNLTIEHAPGANIVIYNLVGKQVYGTFLQFDKEVLDISALEQGVYILQVVDAATGYRITKRIIKK